MLEKGRQRQKIGILQMMFLVIAFTALFSVSSNARAAEYSANVNTDRTNGICTYTLNGIDTEATKSMTTKVTYNDNDGNEAIMLEQPVTFDADNCKNGQYTGSFSMSDLKTYAYKEYTVSFVMSDNFTVQAPTKCDFTVHSENMVLKVDGYKSKVNRTISFINSNNDVLVPGKDNQIQLSIAKKDGTNEQKIGSSVEIPNASKSWDIDLTKYCTSYGKYDAVITVQNSKLAAGKEEIAKTQFDVALTYGKIGSKSTAKTEKNQTFRVFVEKVNSALVVKDVTFNIYNSAGKIVCTSKGVHNGTSTYYYSDIPLKSINYKFGKYKIEVLVTDNAGITRTLKATGNATLKVKNGTLTVVKLSNGTCKFKIVNVYIPGNIKRVRFKVYSIKNGKRKFEKSLIGVYSNKAYIANYKYTEKGRFQVIACGYTQWNREIKFRTKEFNVKTVDVGKNGWRYETYAGKTYKFYYKNGDKVTDLTNILKLKKGNNKFKIVVNRAACCVTIYAYDSQKKGFIIPIKTCTVSVGRDTATVSGESGLTTTSSYTPLGSYSISSNGQASKYSLKPMNEPDGSTVYARWASHVVGNVYFHAIAVGSKSHYALNPTTYNKLGSAASAGCIRMTVADAKWLYDYVAVGSQVKIEKGNSKQPGPLGKEAAIKVTGSINYDPTDPSVPISTKKKDYKAGKISGYMTGKGVKVGY